jgi:hypothetical protein
MKKIVAIALMLAAAVAGATGYEDWFTPQKGWNGYSVPVHIQFGSSGGKDFNFPVVANLGDIMDVLNAGAKDVPQTAKNAYIVSMSALANSIFAACQAQMNKVKIDNLGAALEGVFVSTYGQYVDEQGNVLSKSRSGVDTSKLRQQLIANKNAVVSGGQAAGGSEQNPLTIVVTQKPYDERQFEQHIESGRSLTSLHGWYSLSDSDTAGLDGSDGWAFANKHYFIPFSNGKSSTLGWLKWNGWDAGCLSAGDDVTGGSNDKPLRLYGWTTADNCIESIQNLLTNETATVDRSKHKILTRYDSGSGATIHWMPFDESVIGGGSECHADDKTIELTYDEGASSEDPKKFRLKGFDTAKPEQATDGAVLPFVDATSDDLQWGSIMDFFADSVFRQSSETGKILLNGTSEEGKVKVLAMTGSGGDDQTISALTFDNASIDGNPAVGGVVQLHGFDVAPSPYASGDVSFADVLTNTATQITGMSVPVRIPARGTSSGATVAYVPMGKITGIPAAAVDNKTVEVNEINPTNKFLQLHGAAGEDITLKEGDIYQIGSDGKGKFERLGVDAGIGAIPYKTADGTGLGWLEGEDGKDRIPLIHTNSTPTSIAIGLSLDKANVEEVSTLNVAGFTDGGNCGVSLNKMLSDPHESDNRSTHQFMARYKKGDEVPSVHWVKMDDIINGGTAVRLVGTDGSEAIVGSASRTNTITFASAPDSNVKATVVGDDAGNITVTFGVYYLQESNLNGGSGGGL